MRRFAHALVLALLLATLAACGGDDRPTPKPTQDAERAQAADAFAKAYATFRADFAAGTALGNDDGLQNATRSVRAIRAAYFDLDRATRKIEMPDDVAPDVNAMLGAIGDLIAALDKQGATTTSEDFEAAKPESSAALQQADDAIQVVVDALGAGTDAESGAGTSGTTKQRKVDTDYVSGESVEDADAWVADLLEVGSANVDHETPSEDMGVVVAWRAAFPAVLGDPAWSATSGRPRRTVSRASRCSPRTRRRRRAGTTRISSRSPFATPPVPVPAGCSRATPTPPMNGRSG